MTVPDLTGATVIHVHPGDKLLFVLRDRNLTVEQAEELKRRLADVLDGVEASIVAGVEQVVVQVAELNDIEAAGSCCCNGCVGEGPCDRGGV